MTQLLISEFAAKISQSGASFVKRNPIIYLYLKGGICLDHFGGKLRNSEIGSCIILLGIQHSFPVDKNWQKQSIIEISVSPVKLFYVAICRVKLGVYCLDLYDL